MSIKRSSIHLIVAMGLVISLVAMAIPARSAFSLQSGSGSTPILLIVNSSAANKFGAYFGEILRAEGLNAFDQVELNNLTSSQLTQYDLAILAQTPLRSAQASMLSTYVSGGGALLAMRPDPQIASLFGLGPSAGTLSTGYLQIKTTATFNGVMPGLGLTPATLQIHGDTDRYALAAGA